MKFKIDENLPQDIAGILRASGHDAASIFDEALSGATDPGVYAICQAEQRILVTLDLDFSNIHRYPPADSAGILVLRLVRQDKPRVLGVVEKLLPVLRNQSPVGQLWIVEEDRLRIRE